MPSIMPRRYDIAWLPTYDPGRFQAELLGELRSCAMQTSSALVAGATPSRPRITAAQVPRWMSHDDGRGRIVELIQLAKDWASFPELREAMIREPPRSHRWAPPLHETKARSGPNSSCSARVVRPRWTARFRHGRGSGAANKAIGLCGGRVMQDTPYERSLRASAPNSVQLSRRLVRSCEH